MHRSPLPIAFVFIALLTLPTPSRAAPCCMSATAFGIGRLLIWEDFALGLRTSLSPGLGDWDNDGHWRAWDSDSYTETEWRSELWAMAALDRRASLFARIPAVVLARSAAYTSDTDGGLGDLSLGIRYELLSIGELLELPAIAVTFAILAPTGRATEASRSPLGADVTGRGAWVLSTGLSFELTRLPWFVRLDAGLSVPLPAERPDLNADQRLGLSVDLALSGGLEVSDGLVLSLVPRLTITDQTRLDEDPVANTSRLDFGLAVTGSWRIDPHWTMQAALDAPLPIDGLGRNQTARLQTTLGLRYGSF
jgi:hypothetical protein